MIRVICQYGAMGLAITWGLAAGAIMVDGVWMGDLWEQATGLVLLLWWARLLWL